jgi:hypothetical protein
MPPSHIYLKKKSQKKNKQKKKRKKKRKKWGGSATPFGFFFLKNKICNEGILEKKKERLKWSNYNNLKVWEGGRGGRVKCHI